MNAGETRAVVMQVLQLAASAGDLATAVEQFVAPSAIGHMPNGDIGQGQQASGGFLAEAYEAFPDLVLTLEGLMVVGDLAAIQYVMEGTHTGTFRGFPSTGKAVVLPVCTVLRFEGGLIAEIWYYANLYAPLVGTLGPVSDDANQS